MQHGGGFKDRIDGREPARPVKQFLCENMAMPAAKDMQKAVILQRVRHDRTRLVDFSPFLREDRREHAIHSFLILLNKHILPPGKVIVP
ncbi:hypothetical protein SDC9_177951 [bioreactor metagenome]|uniref:Uncharacterized protein n=1 Tax=bioreactor metagenome TaxID=1076179 RepID=A0A645GVV2_9ZZZZ